MRKIKTYTFLTHIERIEAETMAQAKQLTLSEWIREAVVMHLAGPRPTLMANATPQHTPLPQAADLLKDFQFGSLEDIEKES